VSEPLVPLTEIETEAHWRFAASGIELNGEVRADWAGRPSVPAETAARLYAELVEQRDIEAGRRMTAADEMAARFASPPRGIAAPPGVDAPAFAVQRAFDEDREFDQW
jgi:hypothetical protein